MQAKILFLFALSILANATLWSQNNTAQIGQVSRNMAADRGGFDPRLEPFYHGVASGDPEPNSVVIWTRVTPDDNQTSIAGKYFVATDTTFSTLVATGNFTAVEANDFTVNIVLTGLNPGTVYYYYFQALSANSLIGRAKTTPADNANVEQLKFAIASCSNYEGGYFNAYDAIASRNDLDAVVHLGDYIYEYGAGTYGIGLPERINEPATEILTLADYRTRYSLYRLDPDLIRLHQQHTMISIWDDHESANDSYVDGAENHNPGEGDWETRKAISKQVYFEWMPMRSNPNSQIYRSLSYGNLCDLIMLDTRLEGREQPPVHFDTPDNPARNIISPTQMDWLMNTLDQSTAKWKVIGNQVLFSTFNVGFAAGFTDGVPDLTNIDSIRQVEDLFIDNWESYPTQRNSIIDSLRNKNIDNVVIVTGDSHSSWAFDVTKQAVQYPVAQFLNLPQPNPYNAATGEGYTPATGAGSHAVEFGTPSISSPNFDEALGPVVTAQFEFLMNNPVPQIGVVYNPHAKFLDLDRHGYFILDLTATSAQADFFYVSTISIDTTLEAFGAGVFTADGQNHLQVAAGATPAKMVQDIPAPTNPPAFSSGVGSLNKQAIILSCYPNPASDQVFLQFGIHQQVRFGVKVYDLSGRLALDGLDSRQYAPGVYNLVLPLTGLSAGNYIVRLEGENGVLATQQIVVH